ncbi:malto-oligosyltrehalose trehalohydrolase [Paludisphaera borealis]|uniref:Malto-oligosyltrehalose trehalohydrolase n=1 Tax=Paludisphaera borealis TaxID=1387353 RepID=A0A1U7CPT7_9BACT|nr:malto-oligosyltrehalose trehalohydrolase [Paludisphaera borealis]APW60916.1 retaining malto-oligosyltrehalose trehalohydrolase [Paludisphaera borealis]
MSSRDRSTTPDRSSDHHGFSRRLPVGAEVQPGGGVHFRVWAPLRRRVEVIVEPKQTFELSPEADGYFSGFSRIAGVGSRYRYRLDGENRFPDPASRFQPEGPHGPSQVVDPSSFAWTDASWKGLTLTGQVLYEMHVGSFTREGTWTAAIERLPRLRELGVTTIELMPVAEFAGAFGWGYDGVDLFAPYHFYGEPDDARRFVDRAHALGLGVILDVVYNHFGPDGCYHRAFSDDYLHVDRASGWGDALNFDGPGSTPTRAFFIANAGYWIDEFHFDGLRLDATQAIHDSSSDHIITAISRRAREAAGARSILIFAENEPQNVRQIRPESVGGFGLDCLWNDDFHHASRVALTGRAEAYYGDYLGTPQELISAVKWGFLFQGQTVKWQQKRRGTPTFGVPAAHFLVYLENHDQVANSARGLRLINLTSPGRYRALMGLCLLSPQTPLLFQGQELGSRRPFLYFSDHHDELAKAVCEGRREELAGFRSTTHPELLDYLADPGAESTFLATKLEEPADYRRVPEFLLIQDLLQLRRDDPIFRAQKSESIQGAVIGPEAFVLRYFGDADDSRLIVINLGRDLYPTANTEPLLAPPPGMDWSVLWFSEHPRYGGSGIPPLESGQPWRIAGHSAVVLKPSPAPSRPDDPGMGTAAIEDYDIHPALRARRRSE